VQSRQGKHIALEISLKDKPEYQELLHLSAWVDFQLQVSSFLLYGTTIKPLILRNEMFRDVLKHITLNESAK
jgi:hypothetical protein